MAIDTLRHAIRAAVDELDVAIRDFVHRYNNHRIIERLGDKTPA